MTAAWVIIALLVLGVPLVAWWIGGRRVWSRLRPGAESDPWRDAVRRHGLSHGEAARLAHEVTRGVEFDDPRLRQVAVDWAQTLLAQETLRPTTTRGRVLLVLGVAWAVGIITFLLYRLIMGNPEVVNWVSVVLYVSLGVWALWRRRGLRRTIALNSDAADRSA